VEEPSAKLRPLGRQASESDEPEPEPEPHPSSSIPFSSARGGQCVKK